MATKITTFRLEDPYLEALDALAELYGLNGRAEVVRRLVARVRVHGDHDTSPEHGRAAAAIAAIQEQQS